MKAIALKPGTKDVRLIEVQEPSLTTPHSVKVKVLEVGICGTDREEVSGGRADAPPGEKELIIGHEMLGQVTEVGPKVTKVKPGDFAVISVRRGCGSCLPCQKGSFDLCETGNYTERGIKGRHGYETEYVVEEEEYLFSIPPSIASIAVLTEPTTVVEKAIDEACRIQMARLPFYKTSEDYLKGKKVLIAGLGPIGLLGAMVLRLRGALVFGLDIVEPDTIRPQILRQMGGEYLQSTKIQNESLSFPMILEAAGIAKLDFDLIHLLGPNGIYVLTGVPGEQKPLNVNGAAIMKQLVLKNQAILGSVNAGHIHFEKAVKDLEAAEKKWPRLISQLITSRTPFTKFQEALSHHLPNEIKGVITWGTPS